ncbi:autotransporter domain-containing protein [Mesorhizobium sp. BAC0120]|uniref:autotransporter outer membrane beta-barrel domain-containing protein n=1 Tax=Mesorhizobium sp. BAC0120 TaxID=3090670 RepID=UPI00298C9651|nr:autotransporter domain-containing protein [Mesorhizobium sp. BAC0120]MDW6023707.1 autotransporter domain-containing protein [Mesorhizobium sp. BAC0120]
MSIGAGSTVTNTYGVIGGTAGSSGVVDVSGAGATWTNNGSLQVGAAGTGELDISNGGAVTSILTSIGYAAGSQGTASVSGSGSHWDTGTLCVGYHGTGQLTISNGAAVSDLLGILSEFADGKGTAIVTGTGSTWTNTQAFFVGGAGEGELTVSNGGQVITKYGYLGSPAGAAGTATVNGTGSSWTNSADLNVGNLGDGALIISNGGKVDAAFGTIGVAAGGTGQVVVDGAGSAFDTSATLEIGHMGDGKLAIANGGQAGANAIQIGNFSGAVGQVTVDGANSKLAANNGIDLGIAGTGSLMVRNGGKVTSFAAFVGENAGGRGAATITGSGSSWQLGGDFYVGVNGIGVTTLTDGGTLAVKTGTVTIADGSGSTGTLNIGADPASAAAAPGALDTPTVQFGDGTGTINFNHTGAKYHFTPAITGSGTINQIAGETILDADDSGFTGPTNVSGGRLAVNGSLAGSTVSVASGGVLGGNGTVGAIDAQSGGIVAPGNSIGTLKVAGNVLFSPTSIYQVEANAAGQADKIAASGKATINGGTIKVLAETGSYSAATTYTILTAGGGVTGTFADVTSDLAFLDPNLSYDASSVYLTLSRNSVGFASAGTTFNQIATAQGAESLGSGNAIYDAITGLSTAEAQSAFDNLSGEIHASAKTALIEESRFIRDAANNRIRTAFGDPATTSATPVMAYGPGGPEAAPATTDRFAVWAQGFGARDDFDGDGNAAELTSSIGGFFIGGDALVTDDWRLGLATGYSHSSLDSDARASSADVSSYTLAAYTGTQMGALGLRFGAANTWHEIDTSRRIAVGALSEEAEASYDARTAQAFGEAGYTFAYGDAAFEPFANLAYVNLHTDGYTESGTAGLTGQSSNSDVTFTTLGLNASTSFDLGGIRATAGGTVGWRHAFGDTTPFATQAFTGSDFFTVAGTAIAEDALVLGATFGLDLTAGSRLEIGYSGQIGDGVQDHAANATLSVRF